MGYFTLKMFSFFFFSLVQVPRNADQKIQTLESLEHRNRKDLEDWVLSSILLSSRGSPNKRNATIYQVNVREPFYNHLYQTREGK